jgi:hypothetical protein
MADREESQKRIAGRYQGNLTLYRWIKPRKLTLFLVCLLALAAGIAAIIAFQKRGDERFFNPGALSRNHVHLPKGCADCHDDSFLKGELTSEKFTKVVDDGFHRGVAFESIDQKCETCHERQDKRVYNFHQLNVVKNRSCSICHAEHLGTARLDRVASMQCTFCHNDAATMAASAELGKHIDWHDFERHPYPPRQVMLKLNRPADGYTKTFASFSDGHPEFQLKRDKASDPDVLKFNHQRHFAADIPPINGRKLECNYCHQPDAQGRFNQPITFVQHCQSCHSLQFDQDNREIMVPHGDSVAVRGFVINLEAQYRELAVKKFRTEVERQRFVTQQVTRLRERFRAQGKPFDQLKDDIERQIFFVADPYKPGPESQPGTRASFYGCALCHDPKPSTSGDVPFIAKPVLIERWMQRSPFDHAKHKMVACDDCHHATQSKLTADVLMPGISDCKTCHSPEGKLMANNQRIIAASECTTCHTYHAPATLNLVQTSVR